ncbi:MAG: monofunctional biosynthetic peptidoglycan transglycosylase [Pseudomonadota bacterium]
MTQRLRRPLIWLFRAFALAAMAAVLLVFAFRWLPPPTTYYVMAEHVRLGKVARRWTPAARMSPHLPVAVIAAEDVKFCAHAGFDFEAIRAAFEDDSRLRGGSTISQQVAKNVFLWPDRSWLRKGLEAGFTVLIELLWPKARIVEVYLNVAEFGEGVFGAEAAARHHFGRSAADLSAAEAARLAAILPNPKSRSPVSLTPFLDRRVRSIRGSMETLEAEDRLDCLATG